MVEWCGANHKAKHKVNYSKTYVYVKDSETRNISLVNEFVSRSLYSEQGGKEHDYNDKFEYKCTNVQCNVVSSVTNPSLNSIAVTIAIPTFSAAINEHSQANDKAEYPGKTHPPEMPSAQAKFSVYLFI